MFVNEYVWAIPSVCVSVCVSMLSNDFFIRLGNDSGVWGTILGDTITYAHNIHGPCLYF